MIPRHYMRDGKGCYTNQHDKKAVFLFPLINPDFLKSERLLKPLCCLQATTDQAIPQSRSFAELGAWTCSAKREMLYNEELLPLTTRSKGVSTASLSNIFPHFHRTKWC